MPVDSSPIPPVVPPLVACCVEHRQEFVHECPRCLGRRRERQVASFMDFMYGDDAARVIHTHREGTRLW